MDQALSFSLLAAVGLLIGIFSGLLGIGGGTVIVPVFRLAFGMSALASTATSLFVIVPTSLAGAAARIRQKACILPLGLAAGLGGALTSVAGVWLSSVSPAWLVMVVAAAVITYSAATMLVQAARLKEARLVDGEPVAGGGPGSSGTAAGGGRLRLSPSQVAVGFPIGLAAGLVAGYIGVGGGFLMIPLMIAVLGVSMKEASGASLVAMVILAIPGVVGHAALENIDFLAGIAVAAGSVPGAVIGARLVKRVPERALRFVFGGFLIVAAALLVLNELGLWAK
ncbi:MAG: sulfite exporter TauE/SafE family protein [Eggerthellaceae bacterium]|nr:sulfite exporter TauE/SafE family protein [Eggerthellaceae bacterium]